MSMEHEVLSLKHITKWRFICLIDLPRNLYFCVLDLYTWITFSSINSRILLQFCSVKERLNIAFSEYIGYSGGTTYLQKILDKKME